MPKKTMTRIAVTILAAIIALFAAMPAHAGQTYIFKNGYKVDIPKGFNQTDAKDREVTFLNKKNGATVIIKIYDKSGKKKLGDISLEEIGERVKKRLESDIYKLKLISSRVKYLGNHKAYVIEGIDGRYDVSFIVYAIKFKDYLFVLTCGGPAGNSAENNAENKAAFRSIAKSIGKKK